MEVRCEEKTMLRNTASSGRVRMQRGRPHSSAMSKGPAEQSRAEQGEPTRSYASQECHWLILPHLRCGVSPLLFLSFCRLFLFPFLRSFFLDFMFFLWHP